MNSFKLLLLCALAALVVAKDYTGYRLVSITPKLKTHVLLLGQWQHDPEFDVWSRIRDVERDVEVLLSPASFEKYRLLFTQYNMPYTVINDNIQKVIEEERAQIEETRMKLKDTGRVQFSSFERHATILAFLAKAANDYPAIASTYVPGKSGEGRDLTVLQIRDGNPPKRAFIDCGIHAREWISPVTCVNLIDKILTDKANNDADAVALLNKYELHFLPVLNPDGYEYSHTTERYWRKNRRVNAGSTCRGADLNRNFNFQWFTGGSSSDPCSETYAGPSAASEPETQVLQNLIASSTWDAYISIHSYGMWYLLEWGYTTALPSVYNLQKTVADAGNAACQATHGQSFTVGSTANLLYIASGASSDWALGSQGITYSYVLELRPKNSFGTLGFSIAASEIPFVANEIYATLKASLDKIP